MTYNISEPSVLRDSLSVEERENVLLITDDSSIATFFSKEAKRIGATITVIHIPDDIRPLEYISKPLESAINSSNVVITAFRTLRGELSFRKKIVNMVTETRSVRLAHMPDVNMDTISNCILKTDFQKIEKLGKSLIQVLARAREVRITSKSGSNLSLDLGGWRISADAGLRKIDSDGAWDNLPTGEVFKIPVERTANGKLVIDGAIPGKVLSKDKEIIFHISEGIVTKIEDKSDSGFEDYLKKLDSEASGEEKGGIYKICEFGIGINDAARKVPKAVEYEKKLGTAHIALGDNTPFDGNIKAPDHLDLLIESPTIYINGICIMRDGKLVKKGIRDVCNCNLNSYQPQIPISIMNRYKIKPTNQLATWEIRDKILYRSWKSPGEMLFTTMVGNKNVSRLAARAWQKITEKGDPIYFEEIVECLGLNRKCCLGLMRVLNDFRLVEISNE